MRNLYLAANRFPLAAVGPRRGRGIMRSWRRLEILGISIAVVSLVATSAVPVVGAAHISNSQKWAVLVGISEYGALCGYGNLNWCHKDAADMYNALVSHGWMPSHIKVLVNESATEANIIAGISWLNQNSAKGMALFYFSGHGSFSSHVQCLVPYDGNTWSFEHMVWDYQLKAYFSDCRAAQTVMMFDSCYAGGMINDCGAQSRLLMCACTTKEMCWEGSDHGSNLQIQNGVYTYCVISALSGVGDYNSDGTVSLEEAAQYAAIHVPDFTPSVNPVTFDGISGETLL